MENYETIKVTFKKPIAEVNKLFDEKDAWGTTNLKEWIDSYRTTRFTQISENTAIITSEYNMEAARLSLERRGIVEKIEVM